MEAKYSKRNDIRFGDGSKAWYRDLNPAEVSSDKQDFKVGTRVRVKKENGTIIFGTVRVAPPSGENKDKRFIYFDKKYNEKNNKYRRNKFNAWVHIKDLVAVNKNAENDNILTITVNEQTRRTTLFDRYGQTVVARCNPKDTFSEKIGVSIVLSRYYDGFADGDHIYTVEANGEIGDMVYHRNESPKLIKEIKKRLAYGNIFTNKHDAEIAAKKVISVFRNNMRLCHD